ncbi:dihydrofolate reductase [Comamonas sp.]|uniref:dihydrofolate reductase n=1 Tax=Comamonas sp. TaxID=34028 RepID=UPI00289BED46|nr:dihydrofolate reductase [Comamonas sp.]
MTQARIHLIYARARNGVIGRDNQLPWHLPEDMAFFKQKTAGGTVVMGRKTWDSLPPRFRPLPGRDNVVVTRQSGWQPSPASERVHIAADLPQALAAAQGLGQPVWVIGGAQIYAQSLALADEVWVTEIDQDFDGDAHAPVLDDQWREVSREAQTSSNGLPFAFVCYQRRQAPKS